MASWQAHAMDAVLRVTVKRRMKQKPDLAGVRAALGRARLPVPKDATYTPETVGGVPGERVRHDRHAPGAPTLIYLHGGGYVTCSPLTHRQVTAGYARRGFEVVAPDYRLAPEHPFPAALEDALAVFRALRASGLPANRIVVSGESAGGNLALALLLALRDAGEALPAAAAVFSPWTDLAATGESLRRNARREAMLWNPGDGRAARFYHGDTDPRAPLVSPLYGDFHGLPPLLIHVGDREILRDDSTRLAERARAAGVPVTLRVWPVVSHAWQLAQHIVPEARESLDLAARFLHENIDRAAEQSVPALNREAS